MWVPKSKVLELHLTLETWGRLSKSGEVGWQADITSGLALSLLMLRHLRVFLITLFLQKSFFLFFFFVN
jgi:hypothetical protein